MDTKSKNKTIFIILFILGIYLFGFSLLGFINIMSNRDYFNKNYYYNSQNFTSELYTYYLQIITALDENNLKDSSKLNINNSSFKCYIQKKGNSSILTDSDDIQDINSYIKNDSAYVISLPSKSETGGTIMEISTYFIVHNLKGYIIIPKDAPEYSRVKSDYKYYTGIRTRLTREGELSGACFILGLALIIIVLRLKTVKEWLQNVLLLYQKIPLDIRIAAVILNYMIIMDILRVASFFYFPVTFRHIFILTVSSCFIYEVFISIGSLFDIIQNKEKRDFQIQKTIIISVTRLIKKSLLTKGIMSSTLFYFFSTVLLGIFFCISVVGFFSKAFQFFLLGAAYIVIYIIVVPIKVFRNKAILSSIIKATDEMAAGNLNCKIEEKGKGNLQKLSNNINNMSEGFKNSVEEQIKSERLKSELITNVSHDLKTPLTSIINYVDLLKKNDITTEEKSNYLNILDKKSHRLKILIEDLFEASKLASGTIEIKLEKIDIVELLNQALGELNEKIEKSNLVFKVSTQSPNIYIDLDGNKTYRVFDNLINNILKYSQENTRVYIDITENEKMVKVTMKNISAFEMDFDAEEIFERFKRGDKSRNTEGSGLGLAIAKNIVECEGGKMSINIDGDLFKVNVEFFKKN